MEYVILVLFAVCVFMTYFIVKLSKALLEMHELLIKTINSAESALSGIQAQADASAPDAESSNRALNKISKRAYAAKITFNTIKEALNDTTTNS